MNILQVSKQLSLLSKAWKRGPKPEVAQRVYYQRSDLETKKSW